MHLWKVTCLGFTCRFFTSTLLPQSTMGMFSHTLRAQQRVSGFPACCMHSGKTTSSSSSMRAGAASAGAPAEVAVPGGHVLVRQA